MIRHLLACVALCSIADLSYAGTAYQTDWVDGPYVPGPVRSWQAEFDSDTDIDYYTTPGNLSLVAGVREREIDGDFPSACRVHAADIDGDGDLDVVASGIDGKISWFENLDSGGTLWLEHEVGSLAYPYSLDTGDMDLDGDPDIVVVSATMNRVSWYENPSGRGRSWAYHPIAICDNPECARTADFDEDGDLDVAVAIWQDNEVAWYENIDGVGESWSKHPLKTSLYRPTSVWLDDMDLDGDIDILGEGNNWQILWWQNPQREGGLRWREHQVTGSFQYVNLVRSADLDGDHDRDVLAKAYYDNISWFENVDGGGNMWVEHEIESDLSFPDGLEIADFDDDGDMDFASTGKNGNELGWWENQGSAAGWDYHSISADFNVTGLGCGDLDDDNVDELIGAHAYLNRVHWFDIIEGYPSEGALVSSIYYMGNDPDWGAISWSGQEPPGTSIGFLLRASDDHENMGAWTDTLWAPSQLAGVLEDSSSFVQYTLVLRTSDSSVTPCLHDITISWMGVGVSRQNLPMPGCEALLRVVPNPARSSVAARVHTPCAGMISVDVFDMAGRRIRSAGVLDVDAGETNIPLGDLPAGVYVCRVRFQEVEASSRFVVVR